MGIEIDLARATPSARPRWGDYSASVSAGGKLWFATQWIAQRWVGPLLEVGAGCHRWLVPRRRRKKPAIRITITVPMMAEMMPPKSKMSVSPMPRRTVKIR